MLIKNMKSTSCFKKYYNSDTYRIEAKEREYLFIKESQIPDAGDGLYTAIPIYKDEVISCFKGEIISDGEARQRAIKGNDAYFINMPDGSIMDSMNVKCFAKYANDALGVVETPHKNNAKITLDENGRVCIVATKRIPEETEIFCSYGNGYWKNRV